MNERSSKRKKRPHDFSVVAFRVVEQATAEPKPEEAEPDLTPEERHAAAVALGRLGGKKGGRARAEKLSPERRREIARKAAQTRWAAKTDAPGMAGR